MAQYAKVIDVLTTGFAEIVLIDENGEESDERYIANFDKKRVKARHGDIVEVEPKDSRTVRDALIAYVIPPVAFIYGIFVTRNLGWGERILAGAILFVMAFVISWIFNRRSRMLRKQQFHIIKMIKKDEFNLF